MDSERWPNTYRQNKTMQRNIVQLQNWMYPLMLLLRCSFVINRFRPPANSGLYQTNRSETNMRSHLVIPSGWDWARLARLAGDLVIWSGWARLATKLIGPLPTHGSVWSISKRGNRSARANLYRHIQFHSIPKRWRKSKRVKWILGGILPGFEIVPKWFLLKGNPFRCSKSVPFTEIRSVDEPVVGFLLTLLTVNCWFLVNSQRVKDNC